MTKYNSEAVQAIIDAQYVKVYSTMDKLCVSLAFTLMLYVASR
jgi:hypothetical protein